MIFTDSSSSLSDYNIKSLFLFYHKIKTKKTDTLFIGQKKGKCLSFLKLLTDRFQAKKLLTKTVKNP